MKSNKILIISCVIILCNISACVPTAKMNPSSNVVLEDFSEEKLKSLVGQKVTFVGRPVNLKMGAAIELRNENLIWIQNLNSWPNRIHANKSISKTLKIEGVLIDMYDLPVLAIHSNKKEKRQGISISDSLITEKSKYRFLLKNVVWDIVK